MATGESWHAIMFDCARQKSVIFDCKVDPQFEDLYNPETGELETPGCGNKFTATLFCVLFMFVVSFIFLNLFIAIILESFESSMDDERLQIGESTINKFQDIWRGDKFDPKGTKFIKIANFATTICHQGLAVIVDRARWREGRRQLDMYIYTYIYIYIYI